MVKVIAVEGTRIGFRNFSGAEGPYNKAGERSFAIFLDEARAQELLQAGWNVKFPKEFDPNDEDDTRSPHLAVSVAYNMYPPKIILVAGDSVTPLQEEEIGILDWSEITNVDVVIRPYEWSVNGNTGVKAYLKALYVTIETDQFSAKYGV